MTNFNRALLLILFFLQTGCSLFFGNIKPSDEKSTSYGILDLSLNHSDWVKLDPKNGLDATSEQNLPPESGASDVAYQSRKTSSIISISSACRDPESKEPQKSLQQLTHELLLGISDTTTKEEKLMTLQNSPALETTVKGRINGEEMKLRTVVIQREKCVYDLMYVSRPEHFSENEMEFSQFVSSLHMK